MNNRVNFSTGIKLIVLFLLFLGVFNLRTLQKLLMTANSVIQSCVRVKPLDALAEAPLIKHKVIDEDYISNKGIFVVGDVHGCYDEMVELLEMAQVERNTLVIFLGDMINKGPKNIETLNFIMNSSNYLAVRGNHEDKVLRKLEILNYDPIYEVSDGLQWIYNLTNDHIEYLKRLPYTISIPSQKNILVHAGLMPKVPLENQKPMDMLYLRNLSTIRNNTETYFMSTKNRGDAWASHWSGPEHVYFGHDARRKLQLHEFCTGIDTGCVYGFELTGMYITGSKKRYSVRAWKVYEEPED